MPNYYDMTGDHATAAGIPTEPTAQQQHRATPATAAEKQWDYNSDWSRNVQERKRERERRERESGE